MLDKKLINKIKKDYEEYDIGRRIVIKNSNDILKASKQCIFALHRNNKKEADQYKKEAEKSLKYLQEKIKKTAKLHYEGAYLAAVEEFVEAQLFYQFITKGKVGPIKDFEIAENSYLGGLSDLCGELARRSVYLATKRKYQEVEVYHKMVEEIMAEMIKFNFSGLLRQKFDQAKNHLRKIEDIMYDLQLKRGR